MSTGLIVTDLDGTLLDKRGRVSARNRAALHAAHAAGWHVAIATGRTWAESHAAIDCVSEDAFFIGAAGASLHAAGDGRVLSTRTIGAELATAVASRIVASGHRAHLLLDPSQAGHDYLFVGTAPLDPATEWWLTSHPVQARDWHALPDDAHDHLHSRVLRVGTVGPERHMHALAEAVTREFCGQLAVRQWMALTAEEAALAEGQTNMLEIFTAGVDKWTMALEIAGRLGVGADRIVALGDGLNDADLLRNAGLSIAMANADPRVAVHAHERTASNDDDGVALAVERLLAGTLQVPRVGAPPVPAAARPFRTLAP